MEGLLSLGPNPSSFQVHPLKRKFKTDKDLGIHIGRVKKTCFNKTFKKGSSISVLEEPI